MGNLMSKYPYLGKEKAIHVDWKNGRFTYVNGIEGRINRNGGIIELKVPHVSPEQEYLLKQRFAGQDYRIALPDVMLWQQDYVEDGNF